MSTFCKLLKPTAHEKAQKKKKKNGAAWSSIPFISGSHTAGMSPPVISVVWFGYCTIPARRLQIEGWEGEDRCLYLYKLSMTQHFFYSSEQYVRKCTWQKSSHTYNTNKLSHNLQMCLGPHLAIIDTTWEKNQSSSAGSRNRLFT